MKLTPEETKVLAAKLLAQLLSSEEAEPQPAGGSAENAQILAKLTEMNARLVQIENRFIADAAAQTNAAGLINPVFPVFLHSSQERFAVEENEGQNEKACRFEPGGKPCDHCAMCSSRGF